MDTNTLAALRATHELYCQLTGQKLSLRFDRERLWYEFLRAGFSAQDLKSVVAYLQKEIRASRRNVGALKLSLPAWLKAQGVNPLRLGVHPAFQLAYPHSCFVIQPFDEGIFDRRYNDIFEPSPSALSIIS